MAKRVKDLIKELILSHFKKDTVPEMLYGWQEVRKVELSWFWGKFGVGMRPDPKESRRPCGRRRKARQQKAGFLQMMQNELWGTFVHNSILWVKRLVLAEQFIAIFVLCDTWKRLSWGHVIVCFHRKPRKIWPRSNYSGQLITDWRKDRHVQRWKIVILSWGEKMFVWRKAQRPVCLGHIPQAPSWEL